MALQKQKKKQSKKDVFSDLLVDITTLKTLITKFHSISKIQSSC